MGFLSAGEREGVKCMLKSSYCMTRTAYVCKYVMAGFRRDRAGSLVGASFLLYVLDIKRAHFCLATTSGFP